MNLRLLLFLLPVLMFSCLPDRCKDVYCNNGGTCVDGQCACLNGYSGTHCDSVWNEKFQGEWELYALTIGDTLQLNKRIQVMATQRPDEFVMLNLTEEIDSLFGRRSSLYRFSIVQRVVDSSLSITGGAGMLDSSALSFTSSLAVQSKGETGQYVFLFERR